MSRASDEVGALVSGLPRAERERRLFLVLQAVIDDSGNEPSSNTYVLAGFLSAKPRWEAFADEWRAVLDQPNPRRLSHYKFSQSLALKGEFSDAAGWTEELRDQRVAALATVAAKHAMHRFEVSMRHDDFEMIRAVPVFERTLLSDHPYAFLALSVVSTVSAIALINGLTDPIDFVFDSQGGFEAELQRLWPMHRGPQHSPWGSVEIGQCFFHDEKRFTPLQAADMWAGAVRLGLMTNIALPATNIIGLGLSGVSDHMSQNDIHRFARRLLAEAERRSAAEPHRPLQEFDLATAARTRRRNRLGPKPTRRERKAKKTD